MYYVYECAHLGKIFGCEFGSGLGCDRSACRNCGGDFVIWQGEWGIFECRTDGQYYPARALKTGSNWKALRHELKTSGRDDRVMIFIKDKVVAVGETPLAWWRQRSARWRAGPGLSRTTTKTRPRPSPGR